MHVDDDRHSPEQCPDRHLAFLAFTDRQGGSYPGVPAMPIARSSGWSPLLIGLRSMAARLATPTRPGCVTTQLLDRATDPRGWNAVLRSRSAEERRVASA